MSETCARSDILNPFTAPEAAEILPATSSNPTPVELILHPYQVPVSYDEVRQLVPRLREAYHDRIDMILHMGTTTNRNFYAIEKRGHRDGYDQKHDITGFAPPSDDGATYWKDCPAQLETSLDFEDVWTRWRNALLLGSPESLPELNSVVLRPSEDAGHFLCDFLYYSSLAEYWKNQKDKRGDAEGAKGNKVQDRPVMFMQVPGRSSGDDLKVGRIVTLGLIRALAESWSARTRSGAGKADKAQPGP
ncbi:hypothetical protein MBLNU459_g7814t1 [Dothideomycetes sp. NU459]